jgi:Spy/CpxP family protein refolding chaperone
MTILRHTATAAFLAASLAAAIPQATAADPSDAPPHAMMPGPWEHQHEGGDVGPGMPFGHLHRLHGLHGLHLTEAQQDKLFAIEHAAAPEQRELDKAIRKAHEVLRDLSHADRFDEARAAAASRELGQAEAAHALAQARLEAKVLAVLTPEQREQLRSRRPPGGPEQGGPEQGGPEHGGPAHP